MADPLTIFVAIAAPSAALLGGLSGFFASIVREQRQARREAQEAKREFGADVRALFQERVAALESARGREHVQDRNDALRGRLAAVEDEYFEFLDGMVQNDPDYSAYIRDRIRTEADRLPSGKDRAVPSETVEEFRALASLANRAGGAATAAEGYFASGVAAYASKDYRQAVKEFSRAIESDAKQGRYFWRRGDAYDEMGELEQAISDYDQALSIEPDEPHVLNFRGITLSKLGRDHEAVVAFNRSLQLRPDDPDTLYNRGIALRRLERYDEAFASYNRALELRPDDPSTLMNRGITLHHLARYEEALADYNRSLELRPDHPRTYHNRARLYSRWEKRDEAFEDLGRAIEGDPVWRHNARSQPDFDNLRNDPEYGPRFQELVGEDEPPADDSASSE